MRLKSIEMQGFKSFADKIYLDFNSGITAIVGPNGSGKSNISDAVRWVMGEQSIKSLRGSKMEDVIFAGTESRKPLGYAEVTLHLDNTDGYFSLDFPEISVTRRVYRSGEGEYYINKSACRLKDIHELFMDTGLGRDGYSIIGQGKIDSVLSTKSEDRRQIFEEAAGISKYKYRKTEAERKLLHTMENMTRVKDILSELEGQVGPLEKQAEKAKKYLVLRDELRGLDINVSIINVEKIKDEVSKISEELEILNSEIEEVSGVLAETDTEISDMYDKIRNIDIKIAGVSESESDISQKISETEKNELILKNDIEHNLENIERLNKEVEMALKNIEAVETEISEHKNLLLGLNELSEQNVASINEITALSKKTDESADVKNEALQKLKSQIAELDNEINGYKSSIENMIMLRDSFEKRKEDIGTELKNKSGETGDLEDGLKKAEEQEKRLKNEISDYEIEQRKIENELKTKKEEADELNNKKNEKLLELSKMKSRRSMLMDMERDFEGYGKGVRSVMTANRATDLKGAKILGPLAQLIKTDKKYILSIETALGTAGQNIVTETEEDAKKAIAYLKSKSSGRATFLPISVIKPKKFDDSDAKKAKGFISVASELIECDLKYNDIVKSFLGNVVVCDNIDNAVNMAKKSSHRFKIVTLDGDVIQTGGAMTGGNNGKTSGALSRSNEIETLKKEIDAMNDTCDNLEKELRDSQQIVRNLEKDFAEITEKIGGMREDLVRAAADKDMYAALMESAESSNRQLKRESDEIDSRIKQIDANIAEKKNLEKEVSQKRDEIERVSVSAVADFERISDENEKLSVRLTELNIKRSEILKDIELENERISALNDSKGEQLESVNVKRGGIETLKERNKSIEEQIEKLKSERDKLSLTSGKFKEETESLSAERKATEDEIRKKQESIKETQEKKFTLSQRASKVEGKAERLTSERENIINRMWEDYELTYSEATELKYEGDFDYKEATLQIKKLKEKIKALGNINIDAIEEFKAVKERFDFLTNQVSDLEKAKVELDGVIKEMTEIMQVRFAEQFKVINDNFNRVFAELFGGGRANLSLTEPDNVLESGIEIEAQPPGKKLQSLSLLSGGEKAFTAIALLFSILDVRPTPFCILDEIEAALDDVNVYRYADYLKKYSEKTQFIVVTHRRGTMESADILYGVTMQEKGVSKLLSLNINEVKE